MPEIKSICFDLDGVLVNTPELHFVALNKALNERCNYEISHDDHVNKFDGLPTDEKLRMLAEEGIVNPMDMGEINKLKQLYTQEAIKNLVRPEENRIVILSRLKSKYRLGCVTNAKKESTREMLSGAGLIGFFDIIITNDYVPRRKPYPDPYIIALYYLRSKPEETLCIEDNMKGMKSVLASGAHLLELKKFEYLTEKLIYDKIREVEEKCDS